MTQKTDPGQLASYAGQGYQLIPLHRWDARDRVGGKPRERGKTPTDKDWRRKDYAAFDHVAHARAGNNVGVRLEARDLVVDADPRNYEPGDDPLERLRRDVGLPASAPAVETGSGGSHTYLRKPADARLLETLAAYKGLEFKTAGRQVVAAGSVHPNGRPYAWCFLGGDMARGPADAPGRLLSMLRRPALSASAGSGVAAGLHTPEHLAEMLAALDPADYKEHQKWLELMMSAHHATAGEGSEEFADWSTGDPEYAGHRGVVLRRWDSLHAEGTGRVTHRTLYKALHAAGKAASIPHAAGSDDFSSAEGEALLAAGDDAPRGPFERMNEKYWAVDDGGKFRVYTQKEEEFADADGPRRKRNYWSKQTRRDFEDFLSNRTVESTNKKGEPTAAPLAKAWLEWGKRRTAEGVVFDPERERPGWLNLWQGWALEPRPGDWSLLRKLIEGPLSGDDPAFARYALDWAANCFQRPGRPAEVALVFRGKKGTGKGTFGRAMAELAGAHGMAVTSTAHITGRFNSHLRDCIVLFADEAVWAGDKSAQGTLQALVTEPRVMYEGKGQNAEMGQNHAHVVMASNEKWVVPSSAEDERRWAVSDVTDGVMQDKAFFDALHAQLRAGGLAGFLHDMLRRDIAGWHPRDAIPETGAGAEQALLSMAPEEQWLLGLVREGRAPDGGWAEEVDWEKSGAWAFTESLYQDFARVAKERGFGRVASPIAFGLGLNGLLGKGRGKRRIRVPDGCYVAASGSDGRAWATFLPKRPELEAKYRKELAALDRGEDPW